MKWPSGSGGAALAFRNCVRAANINVQAGYAAEVQAALTGTGLLVISGPPLVNNTGAGIAAGGLLFTLPGGMAPATKRSVAVVDFAQDGRNLDINPDGTVTLSAAVAYIVNNGAKFSVDGIICSIS